MSVIGNVRDRDLMGREAGLGKRMLLGDVQKGTRSLGGRPGLLVRADSEVLVDRPGGSHFVLDG